MSRFFLILPFLLFSLSVNAENESKIDKLIGVNVNPGAYNLSQDDVLKMIKTTGFNSLRQELSWGNVERKKGYYSISGKNIIREALIENAKSYDLSPILVLDYSNKYYDNGNYPVTPESRQGFVNYATWLAHRFKGKVKVYEIWNEWTLGTGMTGKGFKIPPEEDYFELVKETSIALKKVDPDIQVIAGSFNPMSQTGRHLKINDTEWFVNLSKLGILKYIDGVSIHPYSFLNRDKTIRSPEENFGKVVMLQNLLKKVSTTKSDIPIYITEMGVSNFRGNGGASEDSSADFIVKYTAMMSTLPYVKGIWWYDLINDGPSLNEKEHNFGFYNYDKTQKKVVEPFIKLMKEIKSGTLKSCTVEYNKKSVIIKESDNKKQSECMSWQVNKFEQYNRMIATFDDCDNCNAIKYSK